MKKLNLIVLGIMITFVFLAQAYAAPKFKDIENHWAKSEIEEMTKVGLLEGNGDGLFAPNDHMTRVQFMILLHRILKIDIKYFAMPDIETLFDDVKNSDWFAVDLNDMVTIGVVGDKGSFRPHEPLTREEAVYYLVRANNYFNQTEIGDTSYRPTHSPSYRYVIDINEAAKEIQPYIRKGYILGFIQGRTDKLFVPKDTLSRAEASVLAMRLKNRLQNSPLEVSATYHFNDESFDILIQLLNKSDKDINIAYTSGQRYNYCLLDENKAVLYNWVADKMFIQALGSITLKPGEAKEFRDALSLEGYEDILKVTKYLKVQIPGSINGKWIEDVVIEVKR